MSDPVLRTWQSRTRLEDGDVYETFLRDRASPDYAAIEGIEALYFSRRVVDDTAVFLLITIWRDLAAVRAFAGDEASIAKYYPEDERFLLEKDLHAHNHHLFHSL